MWRRAVVRQTSTRPVPGSRWAWWFALSASAVVHAMLVIGLSGSVAGDKVTVAPQALPPLQWRVLAAPDAPAEVREAVAEPADPQVASSDAESSRAGPLPSAADALVAPERAASPTPAPDTAAAPVASASAVLPEVQAATRPPPMSTPEGYVLRQSLTLAPVPVADLRLAWPPGSATLGRQQAVFSVFIDEDGVVQRLVADAPTLSPPVEAAARESFLATRFHPGQVDGRPVKSLIRIEVVYDQSVPVAAAASAPRGGPAVVSRQNL